MPFDFDFPLCFDTTSDYRRSFMIEVRDAGGRLIRRVGKLFDASVNASLNAPSIFTMTLPSDDPSVSAMLGENEIWVRDQSDAIYGKFRIAERVERSSAEVSQVTIKALDRLADLNEEWIPWLQLRSNTLLAQLETVFDYQKNRRPIVLGNISAAIAAETRPLTIKSPKTLMEILLEWEESLTYDTVFWVDADGSFHWMKIDEQINEGHQFHIRKNITSLTRMLRYDHMLTRVYPFGSIESGKHVRLGDEEPDRNSGGVITVERQRWRFWAVGAASKAINVMQTYSEHDNPKTIQGYEGPAGIRMGDTLTIAHSDGRIIERELVGVSHIDILGLSVLNFRPAIDPVADIETPQRVYLSRHFLDSILRGALFKKQIRIDHADVPKDGTTYDLPISWTDYDLLEYAAIANSEFQMFFVADDFSTTGVSTTGLVFDVATGAISGTLHITNASPVYDTVLYMIFGWSVY